MREPSARENELAKTVVDAAIEVHRTLGPGYLESVYENALAEELRLRNVACEQQAAVSVNYKGLQVGEGRIDLLVEDELIVELKTVDSLHPTHHAQVISYLKATGKTLGLLLNFNVPLLRDGIKRIVLTTN